jgi:hypothetical protein
MSAHDENGDGPADGGVRVASVHVAANGHDLAREHEPTAADLNGHADGHDGNGHANGHANGHDSVAIDGVDKSAADAAAAAVNGVSSLELHVDSDPTELVQGASRSWRALASESWSLAKASIRTNLVPGLCLQVFALILVLCYYLDADTTAAFNRLADFKQATGYAFSFVSTLICGGVVPFAIMTARDLCTHCTAPHRIASHADALSSKLCALQTGIRVLCT